MEALANERKTNDYLDVLMFGTGEEIVDFFKMKRREIERIESRNRIEKTGGQKRIPATGDG